METELSSISIKLNLFLALTVFKTTNPKNIPLVFFRMHQKISSREIHLNPHQNLVVPAKIHFKVQISFLELTCLTDDLITVLKITVIFLRMMHSHATKLIHLVPVLPRVMMILSLHRLQVFQNPQNKDKIR